MASDVTRRRFLQTAAPGVAAATVLSTTPAQAAPAPGAIKIVGIACSLRAGKTTAASVQICLDAAKAVDPERIQVELIDLAGKSIPAGPAAGLDLPPGQADDFPAIAESLSDPQLAGLILGTPVYFGNMSSLCKAFLERCMFFRKNDFALADKVAGVVAVGGARNGGQEQTIRSVQTALYAQQLIMVGDDRPTAHWGATLWNQSDDISQDEFGVKTARNLGRRVVKVAMKLG